MRGIVKAVSIQDCIIHGLNYGIEVKPIRKGPHGDEWYCNLKALSVEDVHRWYCAEKVLIPDEGYPMGTLLFFDMGEFK